jgi:predicted nucleotidyltransferase
MKVRLEGDNQIRLFRQTAERLVSNITVIKDVAGIIFLGGLARGFADKYSDVDIIVLLDKEDPHLQRQIQNAGLEERKRSGLDIDLEIHHMNAFQRSKWNETDRWDFSHAEIVYDPRGRISGIFEARLRVSEKFWTKRIAICAEYMKWYCCPPKEGTYTIAETWVDRGDLTSAHYCLNYAVEVLLKTTFALNKEFLPPPKWRMFYFQNLKWLPSNHELLRDALSIEKLTGEDLYRRLKSLRQIWRTILVKIQEETGLTPDQITRCYVKMVLHQT